MGHWYAEDYLIAGVLTGLRVIGIAVGVPGIAKGSGTMIATGGIIYGFSYLADVFDTPFAVRRYNEALEAGNPRPAMLFTVKF